MTDDIEQRLRSMLTARANAVMVPARPVELGRRRWVQAVVPLGLAAAVAAAVIATSTLVPPGAEVGPGSPAALDCSSLAPVGIVQFDGSVQVWSSSSSPGGSTTTVSAQSRKDPAAMTPVSGTVASSMTGSADTGSFQASSSSAPVVDADQLEPSSSAPFQETDSSEVPSSASESSWASEVPADPCAGTYGGRGWLVTCDDEGRASSRAYTFGAEPEGDILVDKSGKASTTRSVRPSDGVPVTTGGGGTPPSSSGDPNRTDGPGWVSVDCRGSAPSSTG